MKKTSETVFDSAAHLRKAEYRETTRGLTIEKILEMKRQRKLEEEKKREEFRKKIEEMKLKSAQEAERRRVKIVPIQSIPTKQTPQKKITIMPGVETPPIKKDGWTITARMTTIPFIVIRHEDGRGMLIAYEEIKQMKSGIPILLKYTKIPQYLHKDIYALAESIL